MIAKMEIGKRYGRLTVVVRGETKHGNHAHWRCLCDCGGEANVRGRFLRQGIVQSCGCLRSETAARMGRANHKHGHAKAKTPEYRAWSNAIDRCHNPRHRQYAGYGERGIAVAAEWREDFSAFLEHIGPKPTPRHTLERIKNERGYEPGNVRWATMREQINNTRANHIITVRGERMTLAQAIRLLGLKSSTVRQRLARGWSLERALQ